MKKFRLDLEDLAIDSFATADVKREKGTVYGEQDSDPTARTSPGCCSPSDESCNGPCEYSYYGPTGIDHTCGYTCDSFATFGMHLECVLC